MCTCSINWRERGGFKSTTIGDCFLLGLLYKSGFSRETESIRYAEVYIRGSLPKPGPTVTEAEGPWDLLSASRRTGVGVLLPSLKAKGLQTREGATRGGVGSWFKS